MRDITQRCHAIKEIVFYTNFQGERCVPTANGISVIVIARLNIVRLSNSWVSGNEPATRSGCERLRAFSLHLFTVSPKVSPQRSLRERAYTHTNVGSVARLCFALLLILEPTKFTANDSIKHHLIIARCTLALKRIDHPNYFNNSNIY